MSNKIRVKVSIEGTHVGTQKFDQDVIKIGKLPSSNLHLDGEKVARMHAVFERSNGVYRIIDLGSMHGCVLDDIKVDKNATLPKTGVLQIGEFTVEYELDDAPELAPRERVESVSASFSAPKPEEHHQKLLESLTQELKRLESDSHEGAKKMLMRWPIMSDKRKREWLRLLVRAIREDRAVSKLMERKRVATMLNLGIEGIEAIYSLTPDEAKDKAYETLMDMALSEQALEMLNKMGIAKNLQAAFDELPEGQKEAQRERAEGFITAHDEVADRIQTAIVVGGSMLPMYLSRAGGGEATDEDRAQWKAQFDQIKAQMDAANEAN